MNDMERIKKAPVDVICYGERKHFDTREDAIYFYFQGMAASEGSERDRYSRIYQELVSSTATVVSDGEPELKENTISKHSSTDKEKVFELIETNKLSINSPEIFDKGSCKLVVEDRDIIKALLIQDGWYAAQFLRKYIENDKDLIMAVAQGGEEPGRALAYANAQLQDDKEFVLELIKIDASDVRYVSDRLSNDPEVISTALQYAKTDFDVGSIKEVLGNDLLVEMVQAYLNKQQEKAPEKEITAKFDFSCLSEEQMDDFSVGVFDTAEEMFDDLYLFDADYETLRDAIYVLKHNDMHSAVVSHVNVRYDGEKYYYSPEMEELERVVLETQKSSLDVKIAEAKGKMGRDISADTSIEKGKNKDAER